MRFSRPRVLCTVAFAVRNGPEDGTVGFGVWKPAGKPIVGLRLHNRMRTHAGKTGVSQGLQFPPVHSNRCGVWTDVAGCG